MKDMVDIEVVLNRKYINPKVSILTKEKSQQVENIIYAIENASANDFPMISGMDGERVEMISQRDIFRVYTQGRKVMIQTEEGLFSARKTLSALEYDLNSERFIRISQSEIINLYKVKCFDVTVVGTIGIEFDNVTQSWASRSRVKAIKELLKK